MSHKKLLVAMSGGVDSSVAVRLLLEAGYDCAGATFLTSRSAEAVSAANDAQRVASELGIEHTTLDLTDEFRRDVIEYFVRTYEEGGTPNPCVMCNRKIKFGLLADYALSHGFDGIATGHYARLSSDDGGVKLYCAEDMHKDQTYVLSHVPEKSLAICHFPLGGLTKARIRSLAAEYGISVAEKKESQDICFIPDGDYVRFITEFRGKEPQRGRFIDRDGKILGENRGALCYTIGQSRGLGIALGRKVFVTDKNAVTGEVTLGESSELMKTTVTASELNLIGCDSLEESRFEVKIRYAHRAALASVKYMGDGRVEIKFDEPQRAPARGQLAVLYTEDSHGRRAVGGAVID